MKRLAIGLAMAGALAACSGGSTGPAETIEEFVQKIEAGECDNLRNYISSNSRELVGPKFEQGCRMGIEERNKNPEKAKQEGLKELHVLETKEEGDRATVRFEPELNNGRREAATTFVMVRENGEWKIDLLATGQAQGAPPMPGPGAAPGAPGAPGTAPGAPGAAPGNTPPMAPAPTSPPAQTTPPAGNSQ